MPADNIMVPKTMELGSTTRSDPRDESNNTKATVDAQESSRATTSGPSPGLELTPTPQSTTPPMMPGLSELQMILKPYVPSNRKDGFDLLAEEDLADHTTEGSPLNLPGVLSLAADKLSQWESVMGPALRERIEALGSAKNNLLPEHKPSPEALKDLMEATFPHLPASQPARLQSSRPSGTLPLQLSGPAPNPHCVVLGDGLIFVKEQYLRRLELENHLYRNHLTNFEELAAGNIYEKIEQLIMELPNGEDYEGWSELKAAREAEGLPGPQPTKQNVAQGNAPLQGSLWERLNASVELSQGEKDYLKGLAMGGVPRVSKKSKRKAYDDDDGDWNEPVKRARKVKKVAIGEGAMSAEGGNEQRLQATVEKATTTEEGIEHGPQTVLGKAKGEESAEVEGRMEE